MRRILVIAAAAAVLSVTPSMAQATTLSCGSPQRTLQVFNVLAACTMGSDANPDAALVGTALGGSWTQEGQLQGSNGTNDLLTVTVTNSWGPAADGSFSINPSFWTTWQRGAISFHVGEGNGDPDWWIFELVPGFTGLGTFDLDRLSGQGGGLSNINLWGSVPAVQTQCESSCAPTATPEPGSFLLMGTGLAGFAVALRKARRG